MVTYYCYFGDSEVGENFKKIIFGNVKMISLLESRIKNQIMPSSILIRYYLDGKISQYNDVEDKSIIFDKKKKVLVLNFKLNKEEVLSMNLSDVFHYIKDTTMNGLFYSSKKYDLIFNDITNDLNDIFDIIEVENL